MRLRIDLKKGNHDEMWKHFLVRSNVELYICSVIGDRLYGFKNFGVAKNWTDQWTYMPTMTKYLTYCFLESIRSKYETKM